MGTTNVKKESVDSHAKESLHHSAIEVSYSRVELHVSHVSEQ